MIRSAKLGALAAACTATLFTSAVHTAPVSDATASTSPAERTDAETVDRFFDDALHASNLRLRIMAGRTIDSTAGDRIARTSTPVDALAESAQGSTDPMVLALLVDPCGNERLTPKPTCDAVDLARRWTVADTQNQLAWLTLSATLRATHDTAGSRAAFERAATASTWHEYFDEGSRVFATALPKAVGGRPRLAVLQLGQSISAMELVPFDALSTFYNHCEDPSLRDACVRIIDTITRDSGTLMSLQLANAAAKRVGLDPAVIASRTRRFDALLGASIGDAPRNEFEITDTAELADAIARTERRIAVGELASLRATLASSGLSESIYAERWQEHVTALARQADAERTTSDNGRAQPVPTPSSTAGSTRSTAASP